MKPAGWVTNLPDRVGDFLRRLQVDGQPGRFLPCLDGLTGEGERAALGFSCFALKTFYMLGLWDALPPEQQKAWIDFIRSFQTGGQPARTGITRDAFIDPPVIRYLASQEPWGRRLLARALPLRLPAPVRRAVIAETKQAIATLVQVGESPLRPYRGFPTSPDGVRQYFRSLAWSQPWGAGGQAAALAVFLKTQAPEVLGRADAQDLLRLCAALFEGLADGPTGAYFQGSVPEHGELINGAMKVLTALDWLEAPIHYPERLIETCLRRVPSSDGCHLVDAVYVLYRCLKQTEHKRVEIGTYCREVLEMIKRHLNPDDGFSYDIGRTQTHYYGVPIARGLAGSDIHGTCLLTWAVAMILEIVEENRGQWRVMTP